MPARIKPEKFKEHFEARLMRNSETGCLEWTGGKLRAGYGRVRVGEKSHLAHRVAFALANGPIPSEQCVCHRCDNPSCCNPDHLFLGSQSENVTDMWKKGRAYDRTGSKNSSAKLTEDDVREIRRLKAEGAVQADLAKRFGVSTVAISLIVLRKKWVHV